MTVVEGESFLRPDCSAAAQILNLVQDDSDYVGLKCEIRHRPAASKRA
jgi:hypothetical protein